MPIGSYGAGSYAAGYDALAESERALRTLGQAPKFDPYDRVFTLADDLSVEMIHPVIHRVGYLLGLPLGSLPSTPNDGFDVEAIRHSTKETAQRTSEDAVNRALHPLLDAGDIRVARVLAIVTPSWRGHIETDVVNLRDLNSRPVTFSTRPR